MYCYINDKYRKNGKISIDDSGLVRGFGIFEFFRTYNGDPFHIEDHLIRLRTSAKLLELNLSKDDVEIKKIIHTLFQKNKLKDGNIKLILTGGKSYDYILPQKDSTFIIQTSPLTSYPASCYKEGIKITTYYHQRFLPQCKSLSYIPAIIALKKAKKKGAFEVLFLNENNHILEGATSNFFCFKDNTLITPKDGILPGVTRQIILHLAQKEFTVEQRIIDTEEIKFFDEAFITASNKGLIPVRQIDDESIGNGLNKNTKYLMNLFQKYTSQGSWNKLRCENN